MGGDGGVVATNRKYMRGAGSACHTADNKRASASAVAEAERESIVQTMQTCAITGSKFNYKDDIIVACPLGKLYGKEQAVKALLRRLEQKNETGLPNPSTKMDLGWQVRGLKDLKPVRFQLADNANVPICPITSIELNGLQPAYLIVKKKAKRKKNNDDQEKDSLPNVLSEKAIKTMGIVAIQEEYGPFEQDDLIRLAPPPGRILNDIVSKLEAKRSEKESNKSSKKKRKQEKNIKHDDGNAAAEKKTDQIVTKSSKKIKTAEATFQTIPRNIDDVRQNVATAVASSSALSSLFADKKSTLSEKQKNNSLFSCNC
jgi:hypothetical protein